MSEIIRKWEMFVLEKHEEYVVVRLIDLTGDGPDQEGEIPIVKEVSLLAKAKIGEVFDLYATRYLSPDNGKWVYGTTINRKVLNSL